MTKRPSILLFDATNIIHRTFFAQESAGVKRSHRGAATGLDADQQEVAVDVQLAGRAHHVALATLNKYYAKYMPDKVALAFDRSNWRKEYTKSEKCISGAIYKGTRRQNMTDKQQETFARFCDHINEFEMIIRDHTAIVVMANDGLEADDLIAGTVQKYADTHDIIIVSADQDLLQLLRYPSVTLIDPATGNPRSLVDYNMDADLFMFLKCIRGDNGDNVRSAFPKVRTTRLMRAYADPFEYEQLMKETWTNENQQLMVVGQLFNENKLLMDLTAQPQDIKDRINQTVEEAFANPGRYNHFNFLKFCGKYGLRRIVDSLHIYQRLLV